MENLDAEIPVECVICGTKPALNVSELDGRAYCTTGHRGVGDSQIPLRSCAVCRRTRRERPTPGRPAVYCSEACRRTRERELNTATLEFGRGDAPPEDEQAAQAALERAEALFGYWYSERLPGDNGQHLHLVKETKRMRWSGQRPPKPLKRPTDPKVRRALAERIKWLANAVQMLRNRSGAPVAALWERESEQARRRSASDAAGPIGSLHGRRDEQAERDRAVAAATTTTPFEDEEVAS